ncbi:unannotated protein [freshwater metagenome]|uniref:Unannotated protein n=1 Tax=freshwater metagenome TaxID=449393 RepID=A0A6J7W8S6_9ZZZZ
MAAAFLRAGFLTSSLTTSVVLASAVADAFLTARLRGVLGSIAMAPNPLCAYLKTLLCKKIPFRLF